MALTVLQWNALLFKKKSSDRIHLYIILYPLTSTTYDRLGGLHYVGVNYGQDINAAVHGSGFPTVPTNPYSRFGWNLNVLPGLPESILKHITGIR